MSMLPIGNGWDVLVSIVPTLGFDRVICEMK